MNAQVHEALRRATRRIAPVWPLDQSIAVNPFWGRIDQPVPEAAAELGALAGTSLLMPRSYYRERLEALDDPTLQRALHLCGAALEPAALRRLATEETPPPFVRARVMDLWDRARPRAGAGWRESVIQHTSQFLAGYFDRDQARLGADREGGLFASWLRAARRDRRAWSVRRQDGPDPLHELPGAAEDAADRAVRGLEIPEPLLETYATALLLDLIGWASVCAHRGWPGRLDSSLFELLAIRLTTEWLLLREADAELVAAWRSELVAWPRLGMQNHEAQRNDWLIQRVLELAYQEPLLDSLRLPSRPPPRAPFVQAVFCIDVRSEVMRRALEAERHDVTTSGFAGFFGLPLEHRALGSDSAVPHLPGLLAPALAAHEHAPAAGHELAQRSDSLRDAWSRFVSSPISSFAWVESMGWSAIGKLARETFAPARTSPGSERPALDRLAHVDGRALTLRERVDLAESMLRGMSLDLVAPVVLLVGHGSSNANNPFAASLHCGACGGQPGTLSVRVAADLLNDTETRSGLRLRGIHVPPRTLFLPALHDTSTEEVQLLGTVPEPAAHAAIRAWLDGGSRRARRERASSFGEGTETDVELLRRARARASSWAEMRPEWGLAGNAAFVAAPRARTRGLDLRGRVFLHDYDFEVDFEGRTLEAILTAPMIVTHWINFQYFASTASPAQYGSGNKLLHDVVGGHLGVFEGNGGDLRIGLPWQSVHDGERYRHEPLRLQVVVEAPTTAVDDVLARHQHVRQLVEHEWIFLAQIDPGTSTLRRWSKGEWALSTGPLRVVSGVVEDG